MSKPFYELRVYIESKDYIRGAMRKVKFDTEQEARAAKQYLATCTRAENAEWVAEHATLPGGGWVEKVTGLYRVEKLA